MIHRDSYDSYSTWFIEKKVSIFFLRSESIFRKMCQQFWKLCVSVGPPNISKAILSINTGTLFLKKKDFSTIISKIILTTIYVQKKQNEKYPWIVNAVHAALLKTQCVVIRLKPLLFQQLQKLKIRLNLSYLKMQSPPLGYI